MLCQLVMGVSLFVLAKELAFANILPSAICWGIKRLASARIISKMLGDFWNTQNAWLLILAKRVDFAQKKLNVNTCLQVKLSALATLVLPEMERHAYPLIPATITMVDVMHMRHAQQPLLALLHASAIKVTMVKVSSAWPTLPWLHVWFAPQTLGAQ